MKKLINAVDDIVAEALQGMAAAHPDLLEVNLEPRYVARRATTRPRKSGSGDKATRRT